MQQIIGLKRVGLATLALAALLIGIVGVTGLAVTGDLPWVQAEAQRVSDASVSAEELSGQRSRYYIHKEARQDAVDLGASELATHAMRAEALRRYYEHKEMKMDSLP